MSQYIPLSWPHTFTVPEGANGALVAAVDMGFNWEALAVVCENCDNIPATTTLSAQAALDAVGELADVYQTDTPGTKWTSGNLPTTNVTLFFILTHARGARKIRLILSNNATGGTVVFKIFPLSPLFDGFGL